MGQDIGQVGEGVGIEASADFDCRVDAGEAGTAGVAPGKQVGALAAP
jgi:hypothetical protein